MTRANMDRCYATADVDVSGMCSLSSGSYFITLFNCIPIKLGLSVDICSVLATTEMLPVVTEKNEEWGSCSPGDIDDGKSMPPKSTAVGASK